jgi:L-asparagine transporter-like permease
VVGLVAVAFQYFSPDRVFAFIVNSYGAVALFVYLMIAISHLVLRRRAERAGQRLALPMWLFPWLSYATIAAMLAVILAMAILPATRSEILLSLLTVAVLLAAYQLRTSRAR